MTHRDYHTQYRLSVQERGEILVAQAYRGRKESSGNKGFDVGDVLINGQPARIEVKSKRARDATVVHCHNKFADGAMTHLAVVLFDEMTGKVTEAWILTSATAAQLKRQDTKSKYINVNELRSHAQKLEITDLLNEVAEREA